MCEAYIAAGLPPERFWQITPRLYLIEMRGAAARAATLRALVWDNAMLGRIEKPPERDSYTGRPAASQPPPDWRRDEARWRAYASATSGRQKGPAA